MATLDETASRMVRGPAGPQVLGSAYLLVIENNSSSIYHLPATEGTVVIGRGSDAEVKVDHASVSRRHATIHVESGVMQVSDLGSHNGTKVNGERIQERRTLSSGDVIGIGDLTIVVHVSNPPVVSRPAYAENSWRRRLAEEIDRAITFHRPLAVLGLAGVEPSAVAELGDAMRLIDVVGEGRDGSSLLLFPEVDREQARALANAVVARLRGSAPKLRGGLARCPSDACDVDTILIAARKAIREATDGSFVEASEVRPTIELGDRTVMVLDPAMSRQFEMIARLATGNLPVLIHGETGSGKENAAYAVHHYSKRTGPFITVNCAEFVETLAESKLFGYDKGAFTGAVAAKPGVFEAAAGGTVFFDELGELPLAIQAKLLRALENKTITRLGETRERPIDVRLVAATNRVLEVEVAEGRFRNDLRFRLAGATVILPPLRDRRCEIPLLARMFLERACAESHRPPKEITPEAMQVLLTHGWPGNVRELRNVMEYVSSVAPDDRIEPSDLPPELGGAAPSTPPSGPTPMAPAPVPADFRPIADELAELERLRMSEALAAAGGVKTQAAGLIKMPIRTFTLKVKQYGL